MAKKKRPGLLAEGAFCGVIFLADGLIRNFDLRTVRALARTQQCIDQQIVLSR